MFNNERHWFDKYIEDSYVHKIDSIILENDKKTTNYNILAALGNFVRYVT